MQEKMWHNSNQMPFIKYSKLYSGFKSVPRKKDTLKKKKPYLDLFLTHYLREHGGQPQQCSNLEQTTPEMGEPEPSVTELIYQITLQFRVNLDQFKT